MRDLAEVRQQLLLGDVLAGGDGVVEQGQLLGAPRQDAQVLDRHGRVLLSQAQLQRRQHMYFTNSRAPPPPAAPRARL